MVLSADFVYTRALEPGDAGQPEPAAAERRRQQRARRAALSELRLHRVALGQRPLGVQGRRPRPREALRARLRLRLRLYASASPRTTRPSSSRPRARTRSRRTRATSTPWFGPSDYDVRHRFSANFVWACRSATTSIARGWTVSGIYTAHTGHPFTVTQSGNNVGTSMTGLPNVIGSTDGPKTVDQWFNTAAFQAVPSGTFGNEQRNQLYGPGFQNFDMTFQRQIKLGQRLAANAAVGHLQRVQHGELRPAEQGHQHAVDLRHDLEPGQRSADDAARDQVRVLTGLTRASAFPFRCSADLVCRVGRLKACTTSTRESGLNPVAGRVERQDAIRRQANPRRLSGFEAARRRRRGRRGAGCGTRG